MQNNVFFVDSKHVMSWLYVIYKAQGDTGTFDRM